MSHMIHHSSLLSGSNIKVDIKLKKKEREKQFKFSSTYITVPRTNFSFFKIK